MSDEIKKMEKQLGQLGKEVPSMMNCFMQSDQECIKDGD